MKRTILPRLTAVIIVSLGLSANARADGLCADNSRACMISIANAFYDALVKTHDGSNLPVAPNVVRTENGLVNARGAQEFIQSFQQTKMMRGVRNVRYVVDETGRQIVLFVLDDIVLDQPTTGATKAGGAVYKSAVTLPAGVYTTHKAVRLKIENGLIEEVEIIGHVEPGKGAGSGWPDN